MNAVNVNLGIRNDNGDDDGGGRFGLDRRRPNDAALIRIIRQFFIGHNGDGEEKVGEVVGDGQIRIRRLNSTRPSLKLNETTTFDGQFDVVGDGPTEGWENQIPTGHNHHLIPQSRLIGFLLITVAVLVMITLLTCFTEYRLRKRRRRNSSSRGEDGPTTYLAGGAVQVYPLTIPLHHRHAMVAGGRSRPTQRQRDQDEVAVRRMRHHNHNMPPTRTRMSSVYYSDYYNNYYYHHYRPNLNPNEADSPPPPYEMAVRQSRQPSAVTASTSVTAGEEAAAAAAAVPPPNPANIRPRCSGSQQPLIRVWNRRGQEGGGYGSGCRGGHDNIAFTTPAEGEDGRQCRRSRLIAQTSTSAVSETDSLPKFSQLSFSTEDLSSLTEIAADWEQPLTIIVRECETAKMEETTVSIGQDRTGTSTQIRQRTQSV